MGSDAKKYIMDKYRIQNDKARYQDGHNRIGRNNVTKTVVTLSDVVPKGHITKVNMTGYSYNTDMTISANCRASVNYGYKTEMTGKVIVGKKKKDKEHSL